MKTCQKCGYTYPDSNAFCLRDGSPLSSLQALMPGTVLRRKFEILEELGRGGMGVVYRARHILLKEDRALKVIGGRHVGNPEAIRRFLSEAVLANRIDHPNVVRLLDLEETDDGLPYVVMEYVHGHSLRQILRPKAAVEQVALDPLRALNIASQVCEALAAAHKQRVIHRDIKPDNILIT